MTLTYNPILESMEPQRFRLSGRLKSPVSGTVLVLEPPVGEPLVVEPSQQVPGSRLRNYRMAHVVLTSNRGLSFTTNAPSADPAFPFTVTVTFGCRVVDPLMVVREGIRDMTAALQPSITTVIRAAAARFDALAPIEAERSIKASLEAHGAPPGLKIAGFSVTVETADTSILNAQREGRVMEMRRGALRSVASGSRDELLAHYMAINGGDPLPILDRERQDDERKVQASLEALRLLMGTDALPTVVASRVAAEATRAFLPSAGVVHNASKESIREKLRRGPRGALDTEGLVVEGNASQAPAESARSEAGADRARTSRIRGTASRTSRDSESG